MRLGALIHQKTGRARIIGLLKAKAIAIESISESPHERRQCKINSVIDPTHIMPEGESFLTHKHARFLGGHIISLYFYMELMIISIRRTALGFRSRFEGGCGNDKKESICTYILVFT